VKSRYSSIARGTSFVVEAPPNGARIGKHIADDQDGSQSNQQHQPNEFHSRMPPGRLFQHAGELLQEIKLAPEVGRSQTNMHCRYAGEQTYSGLSQLTSARLALAILLAPLAYGVRSGVGWGS
jgi:hypothetical protein